MAWLGLPLPRPPRALRSPQPVFVRPDMFWTGFFYPMLEIDANSVPRGLDRVTLEIRVSRVDYLLQIEAILLLLCSLTRLDKRSENTNPCFDFEIPAIICGGEINSEEFLKHLQNYSFVFRDHKHNSC